MALAGIVVVDIPTPDSTFVGSGRSVVRKQLN